MEKVQTDLMIFQIFKFLLMSIQLFNAKPFSKPISIYY